MVLLKGDKPVRQLMLLARAIFFNRLIPGCLHVVTTCSTKSYTDGVPRLSQRSVTDLLLGKTPEFGD